MKPKKIVVFDLDETLGHFGQLSMLWFNLQDETNVKLTELTKNEYRKCRGDKDNTWQPCNKALLSHINESGGIKEMKDDFQLLGSIMITPGENHETIVEGFDNSPAASASCEKSTKRPKQKFWEIDKL